MHYYYYFKFAEVFFFFLVAILTVLLIERERERERATTSEALGWQFASGCGNDYCSMWSVNVTSMTTMA